MSDKLTKNCFESDYKKFLSAPLASDDSDDPDYFVDSQSFSQSSNSSQSQSTSQPSQSSSDSQ